MRTSDRIALWIIALGLSGLLAMELTQPAEANMSRISRQDIALAVADALRANPMLSRQDVEQAARNVLRGCRLNMHKAQEAADQKDGIDLVGSFNC